MWHIRAKNSTYTPGETYSVVDTEGWLQPLNEHPSVVEHPEWYEMVDAEIPSWYQLTKYLSELEKNIET
jgi:hypothetical protein